MKEKPRDEDLQLVLDVVSQACKEHLGGAKVVILIDDGVGVSIFNPASVDPKPIVLEAAGHLVAGTIPSSAFRTRKPH